MWQLDAKLKSVPLNGRRCRECAKPFSASRWWQEFCSTQCRWMAWNKEHPRSITPP